MADASTPVSSDARGGMALVFTGGDPPSPAELARLPHPSVVVAADQGAEHALALGYRVDVLVGDLDSVSQATVDRVTAAGGRIELHPTDKDATDLALALEAATALASRVVVVGVGGGRLDHFLANVLLLADPMCARADVELLVGTARAVAIRDTVELDSELGDMCSLLPVAGTARGVRTVGLRWPLDGEDLAPGTTRGVSNELVAATATVSLDDGVLLAIQDAR